MEDTGTHPSDFQLPTDPADRPLVTLDNNVLIALREDEPEAPAVRQLLALNRVRAITINVTLGTAFERQRTPDLPDPQALIDWLKDQGIAAECILTHSRSIGFQTAEAPDIPTFDPRLEVACQQRIGAILHPNIPFMWAAYRDRESERLGIPRAVVYEIERERMGVLYPPRPTPALDSLSPQERERVRGLLHDLEGRWWNAKNDEEGFYNHLTLAWHTRCPEHAVFVTSDRHFLRAARREAFRSLGYRGHILRPAEAVDYLQRVTGATALLSEPTRP